MCIKCNLFVLDTHYSLTCVLWSYGLQHENLVWESQMPPASTYTGSSKKMDGIWNRYNLKSFRLTLVHFNMCTICSSRDVKMKFYLLPRFLNHVSCYSFNGWCDPFLQVLEIPYLLSTHNVLNVPPQEKIKWREIWASRWPRYWSTPSNPGIRVISHLKR